MKLVIKTTLFASLVVALAVNSMTLSQLGLDMYHHYVAYLSSNVHVPNGF